MKKIQGIKQKKLIPKLFLSVRAVIIGLALFVLPTQVFAVTQQEINNAKNKLNQTTEQRKSLQGDVAYFDGQISKTQSQIAATDTEIRNLEGEIVDTESRIIQAQKDLEKSRLQLGEIMRTMYEEGQVSNIELVARSSSFSEFVDRSEYIEVIQLKVKSVADEVIALKNELDVRKKTLVENKQKQVDLKNQQIAQKSQISSQRSAKDYLLQITKGDETEYKNLVAKLQRQYNEEQSRIWGSGTFVSGGNVKAGDIIGYIGNTGYSSGPHLHFEVRDGGGSALNPSNYINNGYFIHPVPGIWVSQGFGPSSWTSAYSFHTGIDYADGGKGTPVRASADGEIVGRSSGWGNTYYSNPQIVTYGNYVKIKHTNGMYTLYAHLR